MSSKSLREILDQMMLDIQEGRLCTFCMGHEDRGDSPLEILFWHYLRKSQAGWHGTAAQFNIDRFRVDCIVDCDGKAVVIEVDGKTYHDPMKDYARDTILLQYVDAIICIPFAAVHYYPEATFKILSQWYPRLFIRRANGAIHETQIHREYENVDKEYTSYWRDQTPAEWLKEVDSSYDVWRLSGDQGFVGSPTQFLRTSPTHAVTIRRGTRTPDMINRIYAESGCLPIAQGVG